MTTPPSEDHDDDDDDHGGPALEAFAKLRACRTCRKPGTQLPKCSRCQAAFYCGRECQVRDWNASTATGGGGDHRVQCRSVRALQQQRRRAAESPAAAVDRVAQLRRAWLESDACRSRLFPALVRQCLSSANDDWGQEEPIPDRAVVVPVQFHMNYGTFLPAAREAPYRLDLTRLEAGERDSILVACNQTKRKRRRRHQMQRQSLSLSLSSPEEEDERVQFLLIQFDDGECLPTMVFVNARIVPDLSSDFGMDRAHHHEAFCKLCCQLAAETPTMIPQDLYDPTAMRDIRERNMSRLIRWLQYHKDADDDAAADPPWHQFVLGAYRWNEAESLVLTHTLLVYFEFDFGLGAIRRLHRYEMLPTSRARQSIRARYHERCFLSTAAGARRRKPNEMPALLVEVHLGDVFPTLQQATATATTTTTRDNDNSSRRTRHESEQMELAGFEKLKKFRFPTQDLQLPPAPA